mmetsp:Transcript_45224/g.75425  ORF Transcript_45224/g.75425 Transcript_45224/m.75425 type:complete len:80 (-) Transcript_45224:10-249(-)
MFYHNFDDLSWGVKDDSGVDRDIAALSSDSWYDQNVDYRDSDNANERRFRHTIHTKASSIDHLTQNGKRVHVWKPKFKT